MLLAEGVRGLYGGVGAAFISAVPSYAMYFGAYEATKQSGLAIFGPHAVVPVTFFAGAAAEVFSSVIDVPLEVTDVFWGFVIVCLCVHTRRHCRL